MYCLTCSSSCARRRPWTGTPLTITNPMVMAARSNESIARVRPRGARSNTIAAPWSLGSWKVSVPRSRPRMVLGSVHRKPRTSITCANVPQGRASTGVSSGVMAGRSSDPGALLEVPPLAVELGERFRMAGHELHLVGGVVRDLLLGREHGDLDFATDALPRDTTKVLRGWADRQYLVGVKFGTVGARKGDFVLEITTYREEVYAEEHRKPAVTFGKDLRTDLSRP